MSESTPENESGNESGTTQDTPDQGLISDEQLPEDLRPDKNPMAKAPDADRDDDGGGAPDADQPG